MAKKVKEDTKEKGGEIPPTLIPENEVVTIVSTDASFAPVGKEFKVSGNVANAIIKQGKATLKNG